MMGSKESPEQVLQSAAISPAQLRGEQRTHAVRERVGAVMAAIDLEIKANNGVYPHRDGRLSAAEVARRSGIHPTTFFTEKLRPLGLEVKDWLQGLQEKKGPHSGEVPKPARSLAERLAAWRKLYESLLQSHRDTELELQEAQYQLAEARKKNDQLSAQVERLTAELSGKSGKVVPLRPKG